MLMKVFYHDNCFDGLASAAVFSDFYLGSRCATAEFVYEGLAHHAGQLFLDVRFDGDENAIVDFKYSIHPGLTWWFDHHQSAFLSPDDEAHFRADKSGKKYHDPTFTSCTKFIVETVRSRYGFDSNRLAELIRWADIIDGAQFPDARSAVELREPAMKLMMVIEGIRDPFLSREIIALFQTRSIEEIMSLEWVQDEFQPLFERHRASIDIIRNRAICSDGTIIFDVSDHPMEGFNKFIPYYLFPEAVYSVGVSRSSFRSKISVGSNPWTSIARRHNLAALCERHGGGGHPVVGAISFPPEDLERARHIAAEIVEELRSGD